MSRRSTGANQTSHGAPSAIFYKCSIYGIVLFIVGIMQVTFFARINFFDATPDLLLAAVVFLAMKEERAVTAICGIISGFIYYALGTGSVFYIFFSFAIACVLPIMTKLVFGRSFPSFLALCAMGFCIKGLYNFAIASLEGYSFNVVRVAYVTVIPEAFSSLLLCGVSYLIFKFTCSAVGEGISSRTS